MNVHIYKGQVQKSIIFEQMISSWKHALGIVYYTQDKPYPNHIGHVYMMPRDLMKEDEFVDEAIPYLMEETDAQMVIIYTNQTEKENLYLIEKLRAFKDIRTVILMCFWGEPYVI